MSARAWCVLCLLIAIFAAIGGWSVRVITADHRYVRSLTERHEAEASYFNHKTDQMIQESKGELH